MAIHLSDFSCILANGATQTRTCRRVKCHRRELGGRLSAPPPAFTKDLMARFLCWDIQEQAFGGLDPETAKHLDGLAQGNKPGMDRPRRLKPGTVLPVSRPSRGPSPARAGTDRASSACGMAASQRLRWKRPMCRRHQRTSDVLFGRPSRRRLALHNILVTALLQHLRR
jgi:Protein of unknown function (DUF2924)